MPPLAVDLAAPVERVRRLAEEALGAEPDPADSRTLVVQVRFPTGKPTPVRLQVGPAESGAGTQVLLETDAIPHVPYFFWFMGPILRSANRRAVGWAERALRAAEAGEAAPPLPKRPSLAPPAPFTAPESVSLATVCAVTAALTFSSALLSQNAGYVAHAFGASDTALDTALLVSRAGVLIALWRRPWPTARAGGG